jgi:hypothetical protein
MSKDAGDSHKNPPLLLPIARLFRQGKVLRARMVARNFGQIPIVPGQLANKGPITFVTFVFLTPAPRIAP